MTIYVCEKCGRKFSDEEDKSTSEHFIAGKSLCQKCAFESLKKENDNAT